MATRRQSDLSDLAIVKKLLLEARPYWPYLGLMFFVELLATPIALITPIPVMLVIDSVIGSAPVPDIIDRFIPELISQSSSSLLIVAVLLVVCFAFISSLRSVARTLIVQYTKDKLIMTFRARLLGHAQRLSLAYHDRQGVTESLYRIQHDAPAISWIVVDGIPPFFVAGFTLIAMVGVTATINLELALIALVIAPVVALLTVFVKTRLRNQWRHVRKLESSALKTLKEILGSLRLVKAFGQEQREQSRFVSRNNETFNARMTVLRAQSVYNFSIGVVISIGTALVLYFGATRVQDGVITLGQLVLVLSYLGQLYGPLQGIGGQVATLQRTLTSAERAFHLLKEPNEVIERSGARPITKAEGSIELKNVCFSYYPGIRVIDDVSIYIPEKSRVGIAGKTGSGKSTLVNLLMRFYDPDKGSILLDGTDIRDYKLKDLRNQFSIVLQDPIILSSSIAENISYGRPDATYDEIVQAAKLANAHEFIVDLAHGYDTEVGEHGMLLSGGQRQRISLARAFLKDAPILVLDEPTSSIDVQTETAIMDATERVMSDRTSFIIAHRLGTLEGCDLVLVIDKGRLATVTSGYDQQAILAV